MKMSEGMMARYVALDEPLSMDSIIRKTFGIPQNRFYSVSMNSHNYGEVIICNSRTRTVESVKISKSDQP